MIFDDLPQKKSQDWRKKLVDMSVAELESYIKELREEIVRVEADIIKKKAVRDAAASIFKS
ncbi:MAG: DUF1192 domain-containing protein [Alphaproteobacteria bacterium]|nr:DUF1192 domain-containing protein [Alphaproteobacteria bacterium]